MKKLILKKISIMLNIKNFIFLLFVVTYENIQSSQYGPTTFYNKPYSSEPYFFDSSITFTAGQTNKAFNQNHETVPFLSQYGYEDFLNKFIDQTLSNDNITSQGHGELSGKYEFEQLQLSLYKNIHNNLFIFITTSIDNLTVKSITAKFAPTEEPLTDNQIIYLEKLRKILPEEINQSGMLTTGFYTGYKKTLESFEHLDFLQITLRVGILTPQCMYENNDSILKYPFIANITFGYPIATIVSLGVLDHLNFGLYGLIIPYQPKTLFIPINNTPSHNQLLMTEKTMGTFSPKPFLTSTFYIEAHDPLNKFIGTIAYSYMYGLNWTITPLKKTLISTDLINDTSLLAPRSSGAITFQFDYNMKNEKAPNAPMFSFFYAMDLNGMLTPKINVAGGTSNFQMSYDF